MPCGVPGDLDEPAAAYGRTIGFELRYAKALKSQP